MKVAILFDEIKPEDVLEDRDVLQQVKIVVESLKRLRHDYLLVPCTLNLGDTKDALEEYQPNVVFNALDTLDCQDCLSYLPVALVESMHIPHTGPRALDLALTTRKIAVKNKLEENKLPAPSSGLYIPHNEDYKFIIKGAEEDGSFGMSDSCVVTFANLTVAIKEWKTKYNRMPLVEQYINGREFTVPFLCGQIMPVVEIVYRDYPEGKPKILGQEAKWKPESFEYKHTDMRFPLESETCLYTIQQLTLQCIKLFSLNGWGRIDFRTDEFDVPYIIDINSGSSLAPEAWFAGSLEKFGMTMDQAIQQILEDVT